LPIPNKNNMASHPKFWTVDLIEISAFVDAEQTKYAFCKCPMTNALCFFLLLWPYHWNVLWTFWFPMRNKFTGIKGDLTLSRISSIFSLQKNKVMWVIYYSILETLFKSNAHQPSSSVRAFCDIISSSYRNISQYLKDGDTRRP